MYVLDTDVFIWILRGRKDIIHRVSALKNKSPLSLSAITIAETYQNIFPSELLTTEEHIENHIIFEVDQKIAKIAGLFGQWLTPQVINRDFVRVATKN